MGAFIVYPQTFINTNSFDPTTTTSAGVFFDVVLSENHDYSSETTDFAVEKGSNISDHVRDNPDKISLEVVVSNEPLSDYSAKFGNTTIKTTQLGAFVGSLPVQVEYFTPDITNLGTAVRALGSLISPSEPPPSALAGVVQFSTAQSDIPANTLDTLLKLKSSATLVQLVTQKRLYDNVIISNVSMTRDANTGTAGKFKIEFKTLRIVDSVIVTAPALPVSKKTTTGIRQAIEMTFDRKQQEGSILKALLQHS
jgi:hypothetical protein